MNRRQQLILFALEKLSGTFNYLGDIIMFVWVLQMIIGFEWHSSYWFDGVNAYIGSAICWMLAWLFYIFESHYNRKYKK